ncbi:MAG: methionyl-tRNA formyltransferase [Planctomycetaceae bacterium]
MSLRVVLMGTGDFAVPPFRAVLESSHHVVAALTQPDKTGRGHHQHVNVVKQLAESFSVPVLQPERVNRPEILEQLRSFNADVFLVAAYGQILRTELLAIPRLGAFNLHGSLLPRHRGAAPVQYSIWKGDAVTGVTIFQIELALDSGPMIGKTETPIGAKETSGELMLRLAELSVPLTLESLNRLENGTAHFERQDETQVTLSPKITREDGIVQWRQSRREIDCQVRAMQPWPKASTTLKRPGHPDLRCIIQDIDVPVSCSVSATATPGQVTVDHGRLFVATGDGAVEILKLQPEGRKAVDGRSFLNGNPMPEGSVFA